MNKKNEEYLCKTFPALYKQYALPMTHSAMCWGFQCNDGWFNLIKELSEKLIKLYPEAEATTVKEKFGGLRFYINSTPSELTDRVYKLIRRYERKSEKVCEQCGAPGKIRYYGWNQCRCDKCEHKHLKEKFDTYDFDTEIGKATVKKYPYLKKYIKLKKKGGNK